MHYLLQVESTCLDREDDPIALKPRPLDTTTAESHKQRKELLDIGYTDYAALLFLPMPSHWCDNNFLSNSKL